MTAMALPRAGAPLTYGADWKSINWVEVRAHVSRIQMRIAKAFREGKHSKVKALQWILTHSFYAKLLAVKRVAQNQGAKTPGVDGVLWNTPKKKLKAAMSLKRRGYKTKPLKRIYIPKKLKGKLRPLSIPVMMCRGQQALHLLALEPIAEMMSDKHTYGFRPLRSTADAIEQCFIILSRKTSAQYILEADIKDCFGSISGTWLQANVPMDKVMLKKWLSAGYIDKSRFYLSENGVPQGGVISPTILNVTLSGLEAVVKKAALNQIDKIHTCIFADDFIITGATKELLGNKIKPVVEAFLTERGLTLSQEKTKITHIDEGFDFLGVNIRKYGGKCIIKPTKSSVKRFLAEIRVVIKRNPTVKTEVLIQELNQKIRGWANYHRHYCSKETFGYVDNKIYIALRKWCKRRHPDKSIRWVKDRYFRSDKLRNWVFSTIVKDKQGSKSYLDLILAAHTPIKRHVRIRGDATPYNLIYHEYLGERLRWRKSKRSSWWLRFIDLLNSKRGADKAGSSTMALNEA